MRMSATSVRRGLYGVFTACALGGVASLTMTVPPAGAAPAPPPASECTASGLASTASGVLGAAGQYLVAHPDADQALTDAGVQSGPDAAAAVKSYFMGHPGEFLDLRGIAKPLSDLKSQCNASISPETFASLLQELSP
jgi:hemophore-related protein